MNFEWKIYKLTREWKDSTQEFVENNDIFRMKRGEHMNLSLISSFNKSKASGVW